MFLDNIVTRACWNIVAIRPDCRSRIVGKQRSQKFVAIVTPKRIETCAYRVAHRVWPLGTLLAACRLTSSRTRRRWTGLWQGLQLRRWTRLGGSTRRTDPCYLVRLTRDRLIRPNGSTSKDWHDDEPAFGQLIVAHHRIAVVTGFALPTKTSEHCIRHYWSVQYLPGHLKALSLLRKDCHPRVHDLHDMVRSNRKTVVGRVTRVDTALRTLKPHTQAIKALDESG